MINWALGTSILVSISNDRWGNSVLGFIAIVLIPIPFLLYRYISRLKLLILGTASGFELHIRLS
jgi:hypothetical protein